MLHDLLYRLKALLRREKFETELDEELRFHLEREAEKNVRSGMPSGEARQRAKSALGGTEQTREACRDERGIRFAEDLLQDSRYALRGIWRNKAFSAFILLVLALGIGVNTAVFGIVNATLLKPLPFRDPSRLLAVWDTFLPQFSKVGISPAELHAWQMQQRLFDQTAWYRYVPLDGNLSTPGSEPVAVHADFVSTNLFPMLGISPLVGRRFRATEDPWSVLIAEHLWQTRFAADPKAIGKTARFKDKELTIVGVIPDVGRFPAWADLWLPNGPLLGDELTNPVRHALGFVARLRPGSNEKQVRSHLIMLSRQLARQNSKTSTGWGIRVSGLQQDLTENVRPPLLLLLCAASFLLLIACANIASLFLARGSARTKEIAVRSAVGAGALRIVRQLLTESLILSLLGGIAGLVVADVALKLAFPARSYLDPSVLLFLLAISLLTGIFFGLAPAIQSLRTDTQAIMKSGAMTSSGMAARSALVVFEIALTMMLVIGAAILAKSFLLLMDANPGFNPKGVLTLRVLAPPSQKPDLLFRLIQQKLLPLPGVQRVAASNTLPLIADRANTSRFNVPGSPLINPEALPAGQIRTVSPGYFKAMEIPLQAGRTFNERDLNQPVVIINQTMAKRFWPQRNPVGLKFINGPWGPSPTWTTIVGVIGDVKQFGLDSEPSFDLYYPSITAQYIVIKTSGHPLQLKRVVQETLRSANPELAISDVRSMDQIAAESSLARRWTMSLLATFAILALALALVGIFGVMSWSVAQRTREIGIRMALGARREQMLLLFVRYGLKLALTGLACGIAASFALRRTLANLVYGVSTADPVTYALVSALMLIVVLVACYLPARRAAQVDPLVSLRYE